MSVLVTTCGSGCGCCGCGSDCGCGCGGGGCACACDPRRRRADVRARSANGLDGLEVSADQRTLTVFLLGPAPAELPLQAVRVEGGRRVRDIRVTEVRIVQAESEDDDDRLVVGVDRPGDHSTYTLRVVDPEHPDRPLAGFDQRFAALPFSFKVDCDTGLDCVPAPCPPAALGPDPAISYLARDYGSLRTLLLDRLAQTLPEWRETHVPDAYLTLVELLAATGDQLSYAQDAVATEGYLDTARLRVSLRRHARLVDYALHDGANARAWVCVEVAASLTLEPGEAQFLVAPPALGLPAGALTADQAAEHPGLERFEPLDGLATTLRPEHGTIAFWTWGDTECALPAGATRATLRDAWADAADPASAAAPGDRPRALRLAPGDVLVLEERIGPRTGNPADADPAHRQAVRLTRVTPAVDALYDQPVVEVEWAREDALGFELCLVALERPGCEPVPDAAVACGNVVLCDHGATVPDEPLPPPAVVALPEECCGPERPAEPAWRALPYDPVLARPDVTQRTRFPEPAAQAARQADLLEALLAEPTPRAQAWREARTAAILTRTRGGRPLTADLVEELTELWGGALVDRDALLGRGSFGPAAGAGEQDPRAALPAVRLHPPGAGEPTWVARRDLLASGPADRHVVGEVDDDARLHLRFGDGEHGLPADPAVALVATYRVGRPAAGRVGAEAISRIALRTIRDAQVLRVRNPLPASGGVDPEPAADVKAFAPFAFRHRLARAITAEDHATLAGEVRGVQRAAARLRWTGAFHEAMVGVDALGADTAPEALLDAVRWRLEPARRLLRDLRVETAQLVPLDLALTVCLLPAADAGHVRAALTHVVTALFAPDAVTFGSPVRLSVLIAAVQETAGVETVRVDRLDRSFGPPQDALRSGVLVPGPLEIAELANDPDDPARGRLQITTRGGR